MSGCSGNRIEVAISEIRRIYAMLESNSNDWERQINSARSVIRSIDMTTFMYDLERSEEQTWLVAGLQRLAYHEPDAGGVRDIAEWCVTQWLRVLQNHPENVRALTGRWSPLKARNKFPHRTTGLD